jgi:hypothetical protein
MSGAADCAGCLTVLIFRIHASPHASMCSYEWASSSTDSGVVAAPQRLELAQFVLLSPPSYATTPMHPIRLLGGAHSPRAIAFGPIKISLFVPQASEKQALRLLRKGDFAKVLQIVGKVTQAGGEEPEWLQPILGTAIAECLEQVPSLLD